MDGSNVFGRLLFMPPTTYADIVSLVQGIVGYMEEDLASYQIIVDVFASGKLGVGMVANACSVIDFFSWLTTGLEKNVGQRWRRLLESPNEYFGDPRLFPFDLVYEVSRNGVAHQFFPKKFLGITSVNSKVPFFEDGGLKVINALGFYKTVLEGARMLRDEIWSENDPARQKMMMDALDNRLQEESKNYDAVIAGYPWPPAPVLEVPSPSCGFCATVYPGTL